MDMDKYEFSKRYGLEIFKASEIANMVPWQGEFISAKQVEALLRHMILQLPLTEQEKLDLDQANKLV